MLICLSHLHNLKPLLSEIHVARIGTSCYMPFCHLLYHMQVITKQHQFPTACGAKAHLSCITSIAIYTSIIPGLQRKQGLAYTRLSVVICMYSAPNDLYVDSEHAGSLTTLYHSIQALQHRIFMTLYHSYVQVCICVPVRDNC